MFEGLVRQLILGYLGCYVKDIQKEQLKITLWNGNIPFLYPKMFWARHVIAIILLIAFWMSILRNIKMGKTFLY